MKHLISAALAAMMLASPAYAAVSQRNIHDGWQFRQGRSEIWYPATVPGTVHTDLMANEIIEDPFFRLNERGVQWVDKEDWMYQTTFVPTEAELAANNCELVFYGLDTYADVYLNGSPLLNADNMHRTWRVDVKDKIKPGENKLEVYLHSPIKIDLPKCDQYDYGFNTGPDQSQNGGIFDKLVSIFARKAGYHYGWDWGPRLVTSGIWRPVVLEAWNGPRLADVQVIQNKVTDRRADLTLVSEVIADSDVPAADITVTADGKQIAAKTVALKKGMNRIEMPATVKNPRLWWPNGLGEAYLYNLTTAVNVDGTASDTDTKKIGLRSIVLHNDKDQYGHNLYFEVNGKPVFMKGVDMVPLDNFLPRITREKYKKHVLDAKDVNMNMIRVWGGGVYEDDCFYELCDSAGIMVWQDFMFACSTYPADDKFIASIRAEAIDNVRRLRNHPCIALWCGNNECQDVFYGWGNRKQYYEEKGVLPLLESQFKNMYFKCLPEVVKEYGGGTAYRPSSPFAFEDTPSDGINGDAHYWGVWHGRDSIGHYNVERARFFSEYGFQSFPEFESVKIYAPQERDWDINSEVMMAHQRAGSYANNLIREYMNDEFVTPDNFEDFLYVGMILQGDAIKTAMEAHRRDMPYCMGTLVWQHNDCWPVASWAGRDYYGRWKAQQYFARNAYRDILVSPVVKGDTLSVNLVSDRRSDARGKFHLRAMTLNGTTVWEKRMNTTAEALTSKKIFESDLKAMIGDRKKGDLIFTVTFETPGSEPYTNIAYAVRQKFMNYPAPDFNVEIARAPEADGYDVTIGSDVFARGVFLSLEGIDNFFSDNYFDILPGTSRKIHIKTGLDAYNFKKQLKINSIGNTLTSKKI